MSGFLWPWDRAFKGLIRIKFTLATHFLQHSVLLAGQHVSVRRAAVRDMRVRDLGTFCANACCFSYVINIISHTRVLKFWKSLNALKDSACLC